MVNVEDHVVAIVWSVISSLAVLLILFIYSTMKASSVSNADAMIPAFGHPSCELCGGCGTYYVSPNIKEICPCSSLGLPQRKDSVDL